MRVIVRLGVVARMLVLMQGAGTVQRLVHVVVRGVDAVFVLVIMAVLVHVRMVVRVRVGMRMRVVQIAVPVPVLVHVRVFVRVPVLVRMIVLDVRHADLRGERLS
jgi:hypothetical protein